MAFFSMSRRRLLKSTVSATLSLSQHPIYLSKHATSSSTHYYINPPLPKHPSKGTKELHPKENFWNYRLVVGMSFSVTPKNDDKENISGLSVKDVSWIDFYLPEGVRGYAKLARLDKPIGTWLLTWPCMWSIALAAHPVSFPSFQMMALFGSGALLGIVPRFAGFF